MPESPWGSEVVPHALDVFAAAAAATEWSLLDSPTPLTAFEPGESETAWADLHGMPWSLGWAVGDGAYMCLLNVGR